MEMQTARKRNLILDAAFQVVDASLDADLLFEEACSLAKQFKGDGKESILFEKVLSVTVSDLRKNGSNAARNCILSTPRIARQVNNLASQCDSPSSSVCPFSIMEQWTSCLDITQNSIRQGVFIPDLFLSLLVSQDLCILPLEMLWNLHDIGACDLQKYITSVGSKMPDISTSQQLASNLLQLCHGAEGDKTRRKTILLGVVSFVIQRCFDETSTPGDTKVFLKTINYFLSGLLGMKGNSEDGFISPFDEALKWETSEISRRRFSAHALSHCLHYHANTKISESLGVLLERPHLSDKNLLLLFKQLLIPLEVKHSLELLTRCLECDQVNTQMVFMFVSALLDLDQRNGVAFTDHIQSKLHTSLQSSDAHHTAVAFFMARQGSSVSSPFFPSYRDWYQRTFGDATTSPASTRMSFSFLVKCLRGWVPQEAAEYLKTHILRKPHIPARMKDSYDSYVLLAKTRLSDLKVPVNDPWLETTSEASHNAKHSDLILLEVEHAVQSYGETGKVPTSILEASIFRKPYFIGKFLPILLKPRCLPDAPDAKMKLIEEVWRTGRIPGGLHSDYLEKCQKERQALLEGVFDLDDDDGNNAEDDMMLEPIEQLQFQLERFKKALSNEDAHKVCEIVLLIKERIMTLLPKAAAEAEGIEMMKLNLDSTSSNEEQISSSILQSLTHAICTATRSSQATRSFLHKTWFMDLMRNIIRFSSLKHTFISVIINCLRNKRTPDGISVDVLGLMCISLRCLLPAGLSVELREGRNSENSNRSEKCYSDVMELAFDNIFQHHFTGTDVPFSFRFLTMYAKEALQYFQDIKADNARHDVIVEIKEPMLSQTELLPGYLIKQIQLLSWRLEVLSSSSSNIIGDKLRSPFTAPEESFIFLKSNSWLQIAKEWKPSFIDWITFELAISSNGDCLATRHRQTYLWAKSGEFSQEIGRHLVCSQLYSFLAVERCSSDSSHKIHQQQESIWMDFMTLLKSLLLQLSSSDGETPWLLSTLNSSDASQRPAMLRLMPSLHPFLLLSNCSHDNVMAESVHNALAICEMLATSDLNEGGYLSLDITIAVCQACKDPQTVTECSVHLSQVLSHPLVFTSVLMHRNCLEQLDLVKHLPKQWLVVYRCAVSSCQSHVTEDDDDHMTEDSTCEEWMKASAAFANLLHRTEEEDISSNSPVLQSSLECQLHFMEYLVTFFHYNFLRLEQPHKLKRVFRSMLSRCPHLLEGLLAGQKFQLALWRRGLGIHDSSNHMRIFGILRLCSDIPTKELPLLTSKGLTSVISSHICLLQYAHQNLEVFTTMSLEDFNLFSLWLKSLIDAHCPQSLYGVDFDALKSCDPLLYRHIFLHLRKT